MTTIRTWMTMVGLGALLSGAALGEAPGQSANTNQNTGSNTEAPSGGGHPATDKPSDAKHSGKSHAGKTAAVNGSTAPANGKLPDKPVDANGKHPPEKGAAAPENKTTPTEDPDLRPSFPGTPQSKDPLHPTQKLIGKSLGKKVPKGPSPLPAKAPLSTRKTPAPRVAPMASAEAASIKKGPALPAPPMASSETTALHKMTAPQSSVVTDPAKNESEAGIHKTPDHPGSVMSLQPGSALNGLSAAPRRGKAPATAFLGGSRGSTAVKSTAAINGTSIR